MRDYHRFQALRLVSWCVLASLILLSVGCGGRHAARNRSRGNASPVRNYSETGTACWYGPEYNGRPTASGEIFNMNDMTAAHRSLPFNTMVRVTNLENKSTAVVRINDRGPFKSNRIIDVSRKAAQKLGLLQAGIARVRIESVP